MRRREVLTLLGGAAITRPSRAFSQNSSSQIIGYLSSKDEAAEAVVIKGMRLGLGDQGIVLGQDVGLTFRWSSGQYDRLPALAAELVSANVNIIVASGLPATMAAKSATSAIPIVFRHAVDPVHFGLVQSFDRPGGNLTGVTMLFDPLTPKKLQLLHELVSERRIGFLINPKNPNSNSHKEHAEAAAQTLGLDVSLVTASSANEITTAFARARELAVAAVLVGDDPLFDVETKTLVEAANRSRIPTMYYVRDFVVAGGLISYGPRFEDQARQMGAIVGRILKGAKAAEVPVEQPTKFGLTVNLNTAKALGINVPPTLLARADEVIE